MVYAWYDRANMMKTTLELINHSHSLCEIMYVCEGGMSIETEALAIMRRDYAEPLTTAVIARQLHIQPTYLHRLFREHTAKTMNEHLQSIRIQQAKLLLTGTRRSLLEIAMDVGISSQQHFSRLFRKITGLSPQEYRKTHPPGAAAE